MRAVVFYSNRGILRRKVQSLPIDWDEETTIDMPIAREEISLAQDQFEKAWEEGFGLDVQSFVRNDKK